MSRKKRAPLILPAAVPPDPAWIYEQLNGPESSYSFLLESALGSDRLGRYSWVGLDPFLVLESKNGIVKICSENSEKIFNCNPFDIMAQILEGYKMPSHETPVPFWGGAVGFFSYDLGRQIEVLPDTAEDDLDTPDLLLGFYDAVIAIAHRTGQVYICSTGLPLTGEEGWARAQSRAQALNRILTSYPYSLKEHNNISQERGTPFTVRGATNTMAEMNGVSFASIHSHFEKDSYCLAVQQAREYIAAGDIFQVNLSQRLTAEINIPSWELYNRLRRINPAPFASFLNYPGLNVVGASPERFLSLSGRRVETRPIKGTRPRGRDEASDLAMREELWNSSKDRAELTMIIDLERNDLGRVCEIGTVRVPELFCLEEYPTVFHLVSTVVGELAPGRNVVDLLRAAFPGGSITGAPKIRAMEIIDELEPVRRGIYTGSIGWIGYHGDIDLNIVIRTFVIKDGNAHVQVGGAVTADSIPEKEYEETLDKARALIKALMG